MAETPDRSLPKQTEDWADLMGAYRFLNNPKVTPERIQYAHRDSVRSECTQHPLVLAVQDTTELDFTGHKAVRDLGPIGDGRGRGILQHSTLAVAPEGRLFGILHQVWKLRIPAPEGETRTQRLQRPRESDFWPESVRAVGSLGEATRVIHVADRGGDLFEMMAACGEQANVGFLIRAQHDRCVQGGPDKLWSWMAAQPIAGDRDVLIPARSAGASGADRIAKVSVRFSRVSLDPPRKDPRFTAPLDVWVVYAREENPPADVEGIEWMLLTSEAMDTIEDACERIHWYSLRWVIEEWHRAEKTGCRLEASQLKSAAAIESLAAFVAIVAVRLMQLRDLAQVAVKESSEDPSSPANQPQALQAAVPRTWLLIVAKLAQCDPTDLTPRGFWLTIAKRGGFIGRKSDGMPGWLTLWRGWYDIMLMVHGAELLGAAPGARTYV